MPQSELLSDEQFTLLYAYLESEPTCDHTLRYTIDWLHEQDIQNIRSNIEKIADLGGHCDCEVLLNVQPDVWHGSRDQELNGPDVLGEDEWKMFLDGLLRDSTD